MMETLRAPTSKRSLGYKLHKLKKQEEELALWKKTYEIMKNNKNKYIHSTLRKIRLSKLLEYIKRQQRTYKSKKQKKSKSNKPNYKRNEVEVPPKYSASSIKRQWIEAREIGNEYSRLNRDLHEPPRRFKLRKTESNTSNRENRILLSRSYGNMWSNMNIKKAKHTPLKRFREIGGYDKLYERRRALEYGTYYSTRNKLLLKDQLGEFDDEYTDLLLKCVSFEKEHLNVCGFLEEKFHTNPNFQRGIIAFAAQEQKRQRDIARVMRTAQQPTKKDNVNRTSLPNIEEVKKIPSKEEFPSFTKIKCHHKSAAPETILHNIKYDSSSQTDLKLTREPSSLQQLGQSPKFLEINSSFTELSEAVLRGRTFEDAVVDILNIYKDMGAAGMEKLLSDLFLAFGLNIVRCAVEEDVVKRDVDIDVVKDKAARHANALSQILNDIIRKHEMVE